MSVSIYKVIQSNTITTSLRKRHELMYIFKKKYTQAVHRDEMKVIGHEPKMKVN